MSLISIVEKKIGKHIVSFLFLDESWDLSLKSEENNKFPTRKVHIVKI